MLTYIKIKGFESHVDSYYEFSPYFNLFVGESNSGKSSVIRAICVVCYNRWDEACLNGKLAEIELGTTKGYIKVKKGKNINEWTVYDKAEDKTYDFQKIGKTIPQKVIDITGMPEIEWTDITETPNVMFQLDKHYLISEIDGKKCTPNMFARVVDNVLGLGGVEDLIKDVSTDGSSAKRKYNSNTETIEKLTTNLNDKKEIQLLKEKYEKCVKIRVKRDRMNQMLECKKQFDTSASVITVCNEKLSKMPDFKKIKTNIDTINNQNELMRNLNRLLKDYSEQVTIRTVSISSLGKTQNIEYVKSKIDKLASIVDKIKKMNVVHGEVKEKQKQYSDCVNKLSKIPDLNVELLSVKNKWESYNKYKQICDKFEYYNGLRNQCISCLNIKTASLIEVTGDLQRYKEEAKVCPLCGRAYSGENSCTPLTEQLVFNLHV